MNQHSESGPKALRRRKGLALVIVIGSLALATMLLLAMFSLTQSEYKSTQAYVAAISAKEVADSATAIVIAQIQNGQNRTTTTPSQRTIHATQPGMVRVYNANGSFTKAFKLYSSAQMMVSGASEAVLFNANTVPPADWNTRRAKYVDLNEPVVRPALAGAGAVAGVSLYFPIIDPRAAYNFKGATQYTPGAPPPLGQHSSQVEGFWYDKETKAVGGATAVTYTGTVKTPLDVSGNPDLLRIPMPVEWIYFLQDGTMGTVDASNKFISATAGVLPSATNPIVARVAFWTDDESCKININTASEPTFMAPPYYYHDRDRKWAHFPAAAFEYQRYPGHPATVALSAVLAPSFRLDPYRPGDDGFDPNDTSDNSPVVQIKEAIYNLAPKISMGGSYAGTRPFVNDDFSNSNQEGIASTVISTADAKNERLYASVDELLFRDGVYDNAAGPQGKGRAPALYQMPPTGGAPEVMFDHDTLERSRFFLTAHSRSPEFTIYGLPRVCMWPVADENGRGSIKEKLRTTFDNAIALCATLQGGSTGATVPKSYLFRRIEPHHSTADVTGTLNPYVSDGLARNSRLLEYLVAQMSNLQWPTIGATGGTSSNYKDKYGIDNVRQLAVQFFDYIRCTNLYDGILARGNDGSSGSGKSGPDLYNLRDNIGPNRFTYTEQRFTGKAPGLETTANSARDRAATSGVFPGHGQVTPAVWSVEGKNYMGLGRMFTISEAGFSFICTADGKPDDNFDVNCLGTISGGGTALRAIPEFDAGQNPVPTGVNNEQVYSGYTEPQGILPRGKDSVWWSNFPPLVRPTDYPPGGDVKYGTKLAGDAKYHPSRHPGYFPQNWNMTLAYGTPLEAGEKRVQGVFLMEAFCAMQGWTSIYPEWVIELDPDYIGQIKLNGVRIWDTTGSIILKSDGNIYAGDDATRASGGHAGPGTIAGNRGGRTVSGGGGEVGLAEDWVPNTSNPVQPIFQENPSGHNALRNFGLTSNFITVKRDTPMKLEFPTGDFVINIYDSHNYTSRKPCQIIHMNFKGGDIPVPKLAKNNYGGDEGGGLSGGQLNYHVTVDSFGRKTYRRSTQGPHWWCYNFSGCLGRLDGRVNPAYPGDNQPFWQQLPTADNSGDGGNPLKQALRGRLDNNEAATGFAPDGSSSFVGIIPDWNRECDVVRTMVPAVGDYRVMAARYEVPSSFWTRHPRWTDATSDELTIHSWSNQWGDSEKGFDLPKPGTNLNLVAGINYGDPTKDDDYHQTPDLPPGEDFAKAANSYGDFDAGISNSRDGPYVNKPDEGNFFAKRYTDRGATAFFYRSGYFYEAWSNSDDWRSGVYMTPNRMISSPVMFGSLPTGVWPGANASESSLSGTALESQMPCRPWQTLLFRPYVRSQPGLVKGNHPGEAGPKDHYLLDMFFMPVVEPYAISEPLSIAGRVNMNYQLMPFLNIRRATGMHAVMKGEFMTAIPDADAYNAKRFRKSQTSFTRQKEIDSFFDEKGGLDNNNQPVPPKFWHRPINVRETLAQFDEKFNQEATGDNGLFRSASQICEIHLIPDLSAGGASFTLTNLKHSNRQDAMENYWKAHKVTGENVRERPYSNLYARLTTRSNTFRVHTRAQILKKARSSDPGVFDPEKDAVLSEYRGSTLLERYIDPADVSTNIKDYATEPNPLSLPPLDTYYQFRVIETKRFNP